MQTLRNESMPIPKMQVIKNSAPMPEFSRTFMQTLRNESNDTEKHEKVIKTQYHLNSLENLFVRKCCYDIVIIKRSGAVIFD